jgi:uncharacterized protein
VIAQSPFTTLPGARQWSWLRALPATLAAWLLMAYRAVVSPLYGPVCRYFPSCSAYALEAVHVHGAAKGSWLAARRLGRCHPWSRGGVDAVPPGHRIWPPGRRPKIIDLNHPVIPPDPPAEQ